MISGRDVRKCISPMTTPLPAMLARLRSQLKPARPGAAELEHHEKPRGASLTLAGKINRLAIMVRGNLGRPR